MKLKVTTNKLVDMVVVAQNSKTVLPEDGLYEIKPDTITDITVYDDGTVYGWTDKFDNQDVYEYFVEI